MYSQPGKPLTELEVALSDTNQSVAGRKQNTPALKVRTYGSTVENQIDDLTNIHHVFTIYRTGAAEDWSSDPASGQVSTACRYIFRTGSAVRQGWTSLQEIRSSFRTR